MVTTVTEKKTHLLYVDDEAAYRNIFCREMGEDQRVTIETAADGPTALRMLETRRADIVLTDLSMPGMDGITLLQEIHRRYPEIFVLILTGVNSAHEAVRAMKAGAYDYILKPFDVTTLQMQLEKILQHRHLLDNNKEGQNEAHFEQLVGQDPAMYELFEGIRRIGPTNITVLIRGESGTGKELIAAAIHARSARRDQIFVPVNCAALTEGLINSALFGHEKGAFTDAGARKIGFFELAQGGTIFLDEIGEIPLQTQVALLRVLELGTFHRVGGTETIQVDTRIICATNKDLEAAMREKIFREDLFYRLNVVTLTAPPLRDRQSDIPLLVNFFLRKFNRESGKQISFVDQATMNRLCAYRWPGNVRELSNAIERAVAFCPGSELRLKHFPAELQHAVVAEKDFSLQLSSSSLPEIEAEVIGKVLEEKHWNLSQAAEALGIARGTLYSKIKHYGIVKN
ncbi:MAG: sigma-54 dependent transcriptional regulator [Proteobacteria bacterium]|jgi:DNA-binding NtrC family response regulator|nr:sigma-54 dependent transcriptional regulator [Pseudomonadota bacterium]MBU3982249.1 sigma-54 dependent transcriptional regulator [Pseudomonadota bacterium]MBU4029741.1 sigma-54 dependent transcriptional regulator [Pseudomonadota bacterium]MBU4043391.1 sigma-54 dependent transcriptional regulator [Pseudomonadota bacterium]MBU4084969.1 sigma-54 dependent transcriptional regulator [Pseudomonadota bacterium]